MQTRKRTWHAEKPVKKPGYDPAEISETLLAAVVCSYEELNEKNRHKSLSRIAEEMKGSGFGNLNPMKIRKLLITAGVQYGYQVYDSAAADRVVELWKEKKCVEEIMSITKLSRAAVHSYLPYSKIIYKLDESGGECSVGADRMRIYRRRKQALEKLKLNCEKDNKSGVI